MSRSHKDQRRRDDHKRQQVKAQPPQDFDGARYGNTRKLRAKLKVKDRRRDRAMYNHDGDAANAHEHSRPMMRY